LAKAGKVGISKVVLRTREHLASVKPVGKALVLELMHFAEELADPTQLSLPNAPSDPKEMQMALSLVDAMTDEWKPEEYHDEYAAALMKVIEEKVALGGKELPPVKRGGAPSAKVVDIVQMLQKNWRNTGKKAKASATPQEATKPNKVANRKAA
jgi:DNA end-binding protein Ku